MNGSSNNFLTNKKNFIYLYNIDEKNFLKTFNKSENYIIYHGSFFSDGAENADLIIPSHSVFENNYKYINMEGKLKKSLTVLNYNNNNISVEDFFKFLTIIKKTYIKHNYSNLNDFDKIINQFDFVKKDYIYSKNESFSNDNGEMIFHYKREHIESED
jgi:NADH dehydrogenase/NADH:ubiquinone oxidoreductase subunit G